MYTGIGLVLLGMSIVVTGIFITKKHKWHSEQRPDKHLQCTQNW